MQIRRTAAALTSAAALSVTGVAMATPAQAAPVFAGGLVNVNVGDVEILNDVLNDSLNNILRNAEILNDNQVTVAVVAQLQAVVCDNNVNLLGQLASTGEATCQTEAGDIVFTTTR